MREKEDYSLRDVPREARKKMAEAPLYVAHV